MPQIFQGDDFRLTFPGNWTKVDIVQEGIYKQPGVECALVIRHPSFDGTNINLMLFTLEQEFDVEEIDRIHWAQFESYSPDVTLESKDVIEIAGRRATRRIFSAPSSIAFGGRAHLLQILVVKERVLYQFIGWAPSADTLQQHLSEIEEIVASLRFIT